jgi:hypothetical protein
MEALEELLVFLNTTKVYYEDKFGTLIDGESYIGFCYKCNTGRIGIVCHNNDDVVDEF